MRGISKHIVFLFTLCVIFLVQSCKEEIDMSDRYTYKEETIASYLEKHSDEYSEYYRLIGEMPISHRSGSTVLQLMSARGKYTVFAPSNAAIQEYLNELHEKGFITAPSWDGFTDEAVLDSIRKVIVFNSIFDGGDEVEALQTSDFNDGRETSMPNLNDRKLMVQIDADDNIYIDATKDDNGNVIGGSPIDQENCNILTLNGYIHQVHKVIAPSNKTLGEILKDYIDTNTEGFITVAKMVLACGLQNELDKIRDEVYEDAYKNGDIPNLDNHPTYKLLDNSPSPGFVPEHRKYGFTIFAETDEVWMKTLNKTSVQDITINDIREWIVEQGFYPNAINDEDYTNPDNVLNQFITYHILPMRLPVDKLVIHHNEKGYDYRISKTNYTVPTWELYTTMGKRRLIKVYEGGRSGPRGIYLNRFPTLDNGRSGTYYEVGCDMDKEGVLVNTAEAKDFVNSYIYPIDKVLVYDRSTRENFQKQRLRFDVAGLFPEFINNDIRQHTNPMDKDYCVGMPTEKNYKYLEDVDIDEHTRFYYLLGAPRYTWKNYQGDELNVVGNYEMTFRLPPVPMKDTYEIRYAVQTNSGARGMCQVYFGTDKDNLHAEGIPLDLRMGGQFRRTSAGTFESIVGWLQDESDDDVNADVDKKMRANGFMKGPEHYAAPPGSTNTARRDPDTIRRIIVRAELDPDQTYYLKFKSVLEDPTREFYMDYLEFCSKAVYDNPQIPEDIW